MERYYLACDLGAESGRLMLGKLADGRLSVEELHRFPNGAKPRGNSLHWDISRLFGELKEGLKRAGEQRLAISSISTDSWGLDYVLLDEAGHILEPTYCYRDPRTARGVENAYSRTDWPAIFSETGIQFMPINTLFQLMAEEPARLAQVKQLLGIGDAFNWMLGGRPVAEVSLASTFQLYNPRTGDWSGRLIEALGLPRHLFPEIVASGTKLGALKPELAAESGLHGVEVIAGCSHDTGTAVVAAPVEAQAGQSQDWAYISSGTWSLMGVELGGPVLSDRCRELNFTNEIGHGNSVRLLKNIIGLWLVQECRRHWAGEGREYDYAALAGMAADAPAFESLIHPSDARFLPPGDMPGRIATYCRETHQPVPDTPGKVVRCALDSLALLYRETLREVEQLTGARVTRVHVVGGGSQNALLNQLTADACQVTVLAGPAEATSIGNVLVQAMALGHVASLAEARAIVRASFGMVEFLPRDSAVLEDAVARFQKLTA